jgi:hypothetical protein
MRSILASYSIGVVLLSTGCSTHIVQEFRGQAWNIQNDGLESSLSCRILGECSGESSSEGRFTGFYLPAPEFSVFLFHPTFVPGQTLILNTGAPNVDAWLVRGTLFDWDDFVRSGNPELLRQQGGERLEGRITLTIKSNADFRIAVDLSSKDERATHLRGEFSGYNETKVDLKELWLGPAMLIFGAGGWSHSNDATNHIGTNIKDR